MRGCLREMKASQAVIMNGMVSIIAHELATNPMNNAWYADWEQTAPNEIADMCSGQYGWGGGGGYATEVYKDKEKMGYNVNGVNGKKFQLGRHMLLSPMLKISSTFGGSYEWVVGHYFKLKQSS